MARTIVLPSNPNDQKIINDRVKEASACLTHIEAENDQIKQIIDLIKEEYELPKKFIRKMIRTYHKSTFDKDSQEAEDFAELYQKIIK